MSLKKGVAPRAYDMGFAKLISHFDANDASDVLASTWAKPTRLLFFLYLSLGPGVVEEHEATTLRQQKGEEERA